MSISRIWWRWRNQIMTFSWDSISKLKYFIGEWFIFRSQRIIILAGILQVWEEHGAMKVWNLLFPKQYTWSWNLAWLIFNKNDGQNLQVSTMQSKNMIHLVIGCSSQRKCFFQSIILWICIKSYISFRKATRLHKM